MALAFSSHHTDSSLSACENPAHIGVDKKETTEKKAKPNNKEVNTKGQYKPVSPPPRSYLTLLIILSLLSGFQLHV